MPKFEVTAVLSATKYLGEVEADTPEDAICAAHEIAAKLRFGQCHVCSNVAELDSDYSYIVAEGEDGSSTEDSYEARLLAEIERLKAEIKDLKGEV